MSDLSPQPTSSGLTADTTIHDGTLAAALKPELDALAVIQQGLRAKLPPGMTAQEKENNPYHQVSHALGNYLQNLALINKIGVATVVGLLDESLDLRFSIWEPKVEEALRPSALLQQLNAKLLESVSQDQNAGNGRA